MDNGLIVRRLYYAHVKQLLYFVGSLTSVLGLLLLFTYSFGYNSSIPSHGKVELISLTDGSKIFSNDSKLVDSDIIHYQKSDGDDALSSDSAEQMDSRIELKERNANQGSTFETEDNVDSSKSAKAGQFTPLDHKLGSGKSVLSVAMNLSLVHSNEAKIKDSILLKNGSPVATDISVMSSRVITRKRRAKAISIFQMNSLLVNGFVEKKLKKRRWSSQRDRELQSARFLIENAPVQWNISEVHASLFRNYSMFKRSYELMESTLKVYVYREGEKPIFHQPYMRGIYASEGWFMKQMERNKHFLVRDPKKAHLFYLPFSSVKLRNALNGPGFSTHKDLEDHLKNYVDIIATKYRYWKKREADHFLVVCHDWRSTHMPSKRKKFFPGPRIYENVFENCIRALCNSDIAGGFKIGKDVSLPVTYIRSSENPMKDIGGNSPSNRSILAFFAGRMHGYVRPILLQHWYDKEPDMKILGPMARDIEGKARYRDFMKSSKYCICAKGYEVHTPRVMESIYYECVPVIISDNYVPPLFEVFNWESFALFVAEDDILSLREILLSVSEERYMMMRRRLKIVQQYFVWHKVPKRYDLFHMILHSIWYNRVFQAPS